MVLHVLRNHKTINLILVKFAHVRDQAFLQKELALQMI